jgi:hypothetical protein
LRKEALGEQALRRAPGDVAVGEAQQRLAGEDPPASSSITQAASASGQRLGAA